MEFEGKWGIFYKKCLKTLESRIAFDESCLPLLERYVFVNRKMEDVQDKMAGQDATVEHTNNDGHKNMASNPLMRVFVILNKESLALAKELQLTPASMKTTAPIKRDKKKTFDLTVSKKMA